tara:strand:- start:167 stop:436 length:270 start_codon:yes stop_codon:yes gene_type:complete
MSTNNRARSSDYLYEVCKEYPVMVINTECGTGKYHFNCIGYKSNQLLIEYSLITDEHYKDTIQISSSIGDKYYLTVAQLLIAYKNLAAA